MPTGCCAAHGSSNEIMEAGYDHWMYTIHCTLLFSLLFCTLHVCNAKVNRL